MARTYQPAEGLNRRILLALRRTPGLYPGSVARLTGADGAVVRDALARLAANGHVELRDEEDGHRHAYATEAGLAVLRKRRRARTVHRPSTEPSPAL